MGELYYVGTAYVEELSIFATERTVLVKAASGFLQPGNIVEFHIGKTKKIAKVICTSLIREGSDDEAVLKANTKVYEVDKIYSQTWENKKEEETDGN